MEMLRKKDEEEENSRNRMRDQAAQVRTGPLEYSWPPEGYFGPK